MQEYLTTQEVQKRLQVSYPTLKRMMDTTTQGVDEPWVKIGRQYRWRSDKVDDWMRSFGT